MSASLVAMGAMGPRYLEYRGTVMSKKRRGRELEGRVLRRCAAPLGREMWFGCEEMPWWSKVRIWQQQNPC